MNLFTGTFFPILEAIANRKVLVLGQSADFLEQSFQRAFGREFLMSENKNCFGLQLLCIQLEALFMIKGSATCMESASAISYKLCGYHFDPAALRKMSAHPTCQEKVIFDFENILTDNQVIFCCNSVNIILRMLINGAYGTFRDMTDKQKGILTHLLDLMWILMIDTYTVVPKQKEYYQDMN